MSALFPRWSNTAARVGGLMLIAAPALGVSGLMAWNRSPFITGQSHPIEQPVQFDHRHHVADEGIDCRYCHSTVETSPSAGLPSTAVCMGCHGQVWNQSPKLQPVREAFFSGRPIRWNRVHDLPDFVYFNHAIHVGKGVACATCHGRVDQMAAVEQVAPLTMAWCLECHRDPAPRVGPLAEVTQMPPKAGPPQVDLHARVSCTTCHR